MSPSAARLGTWLRQFGAFWYDFVVGDDWRVALGVVLALAGTYGLHRFSVPAWWVVPVAIAVLLPLSLWRAVRRTSPVPPADSTRA